MTKRVILVVTCAAFVALAVLVNRRRGSSPEPGAAVTATTSPGTTPATTQIPAELAFEVLARGPSTEFVAAQPAMSAMISCRDDSARTTLVSRLGLAKSERESVLAHTGQALVVVFGPIVSSGGQLEVRSMHATSASLAIDVDVATLATTPGALGLPSAGRPSLVVAVDRRTACTADDSPLTVVVS